MRVVRRICVLVIGTVLFLAGILKLMDPVGAGLQMATYFNFLHLRFLSPLSVAAGVAAALFETLLGAALLTGVWRRITSLVTLATLVFFSVLTLVLVIVNPQMDCGCFGESIHLTHWQTFAKNIVLLVLWLIAFVPFKEFEISRIKYVSFAIASVSVVLFSVYSLMSIPLVDYTPLKPGTELASPLNRTALSFYDRDGEYRDELALDGKVAIVSIYDTGRFDPEDWSGITSFAEDAAGAGIEPLVLVSGDLDDVPVEMAFAADHKTLMTLNRSNGGVTFVSDGQIIRKWPARSLPDSEELAALSGTDQMESLIESDSSSHLKMQGFLLYVFAVMLLL